MVHELTTALYKLEHALAKLCKALAIRLLYMCSIQDHRVYIIQIVRIKRTKAYSHILAMAFQLVPHIILSDPSIQRFII